jgi:undecaprenyl diphosphate synthase
MTTAHSFVDHPGLHVAIIMDGNGRWASHRGLRRSTGHTQGERAVRRVIENAPDLGVTTLTLYAFSSDNWGRPVSEVSHLMRLFEDHLISERQRCIDTGVKLNVIGRRDRLSDSLLSVIDTTEAATAHARRLHLRVAVDYSARDMIREASRRLAASGEVEFSREAMSAAINDVLHSRPAAPDVDLLIRTSGEQRLSDFMLWEAAYAELHFTDVLWPDFNERDLAEALEAFQGRERRFGGLTAA